MNNWASHILGQEAAIKTLDGLVLTAARGRFVLLHGPRGVGKATTAMALMRWLLCNRDQPPCGQCLACRKPNEHPDALMLLPEQSGAAIKIDNVRQAAEMAFYPPLAARHRVWLIDPMEDLSSGAANALLRLLEEPASKLWVLGVAHNLSAVAVTLRSRAVKVPFGLLSGHALSVLFNMPITQAGTVERASLLANPALQKDIQAWRQLLETAWYNPDEVAKFAKTVGGKVGGLREFYISLLLCYGGGAELRGLVSPYHHEQATWSNAYWQAFLQERQQLQTAINDLEVHVNPMFVCENTARNLRRIRKQFAVGK